MQVVKDKEEKDYLVIYDIITKSKQPNGNLVKDEFYKRRPNGSFEVSIQYLYEKLVETLLTLRKKKDVYYDLLNNLCKACMSVHCLRNVSKSYLIPSNRHNFTKTMKY